MHRYIFHFHILTENTTIITYAFDVNLFLGMRMRKIVALTAGLVLGSSCAFAGGDSGFFIGGGVGECDWISTII